MKIIAPGQQISVTAWKGGKKTDATSIVVTDKSGASVTFNNVGSVRTSYTTFRVPGSAVPANKLPVKISFRVAGTEVKSETYGVAAGSGLAELPERLSETALAQQFTEKVSGSGITAIVALTQTEYNALAVKVPTTLYVIKGA